jgi:hypothetical protein
VIVVEPGAIATPIWDRGIATADAIWDAVPQDGHERYGRLVTTLRDRAKALGATGIPVEDAAAVIVNALTSEKPRTRYLIGRQAKIQATIGRFLPDRASDALLARLLNNR